VIYKVEDLFLQIKNGMSIKQSNDAGGLPITRIETIADAEINLDRVGFAGVDEKLAKKFLLEEGEILFSHINSITHIGKCALYKKEHGRLVHGMNLLSFKPNEKIIFPKFALYSLRSQQFKDQLAKSIKKAVNQASVSIGDIKKIKLRIPPLAEQKRIAAILDQAEEIRRKRIQAIEKLDQLAQSTFIEMFGDRKANPKRFTVKRLNEITTISSGSTPSRSTNGYMNGTVPWVKTAEVDGLEIHDTEEKLTEDGLSSIGNKLNPIDSIVVAMYGQGKTRGRVGLLKTIAATNQACGVIKPDKSFLPNFMFWQLHLAYADLRALGRGGNQENLNLQLLGNFEVLLPHLNEQEIYSNFIKCLLRQKNKMQFFNDNLSSLSKSLQHQAFSTGFNA
jgi:type I restriction enzyme S subunit